MDKGLFDGHHFFQIEEINHIQVKQIHGENFSGLLSKIILKKSRTRPVRALLL